MVRGLYAAATGLEAFTRQQEILSENLALSSTPGYKQRGLTYETFDRVLGWDVAPTGDIVGTHVRSTYSDFAPGALQQTGQKLDLALDGDSFFVLNGPNGLMYSRDGAFRLNQQGYIVSPGGYTLRGSNGPIQVPPATSELVIANDGIVVANGQEIGQIQRARFTNPQQLESIGPTLFRAPPGSGLQFSNARVLQGYRESSNIQPAQAMVLMLQGMHYFEAAQRALRAIAESIALNTKPS